MSEEDCKRYLNLWISLLIEEKTRQRVAKVAHYDFKEHDNLKLPWQFDMTQGYLTLPVIIWMKKDIVVTFNLEEQCLAWRWLVGMNVGAGLFCCHSDVEARF